MNRGRRDVIADWTETSIADNDIWGRETDPRIRDWANRMRKCGNNASFVFNSDLGREAITNFWGCKVRVCPICSWRASIRKACKYTPRINASV